LARKANAKTQVLVPGGVDEYIQQCPEGVQAALREIRAAIQSAAPGATETTSYFDMPGYFYEGYDYNGMFAWFSFKSPNVRLHVRPPVLQTYKEDVAQFSTTTAIVSFPAGVKMPKALVKKLAKASIEVMKGKKAGK
jgi:uncharacterized protein YdhG (YjbR/CyaY superfamily)